MGLPQLQPREVVTNDGLRTPYGIVLPPGANVAAYVRSTGVQPTDSAFVATNLVPTLAQGLARARAGLGDFVICLPGHAENVTDGTTFSNALLAGTKIIGVGRGSNTPTFNFTTTAGTWLVNKPDVLITGLRLAKSNALFQNVTLGIAVTAPDFGFINNEVVIGSASDTFTTAFMQLQAGADRADLSANVVRGPNGNAPAFSISAVVSDVRICDNEMVYPAGAATGCIQVLAVAATGLRILRNTLYNTTAASTACIAIGAAANDGVVAYNTLGVKNNGVAAAQGITFGAGSLVVAMQNFCTDEPQKSGTLSPVIGS